MTSGKSRTLYAGALALASVAMVGVHGAHAQQPMQPAQGFSDTSEPNSTPSAVQPVIRGNFSTLRIGAASSPPAPHLRGVRSIRRSIARPILQAIGSTVDRPPSAYRIPPCTR
jgi:hypothetical protein